MASLIVWLVASIAALGLAWLSSKFQLASESPKLKIAGWSFACLLVSIIASPAGVLTVVTYGVIVLYCAIAIVTHWPAIQEEASEWYDHLKDCFKKS